MNIQNILNMLNRHIKKKNIILFNSYPSFSDNAFALYNCIVQYRKDIADKYRLVWAYPGKEKIPTFIKNAEIVEKKTIKGIWLFLRAKYVISTHGYFIDVHSAKGQVQINLWHGCGYKKITEKDRCYRGDITLAVSDLYKEIQSVELEIDPKLVLVTGYPRNDFLFYSGNGLGKLGIEKGKYKKTLIWMPTYRKANIGHAEMDGNANSFGLASLDSTTLNNLNDILYKNQYLLIIKPHPMESVELLTTEKYSNILIVTNSLLTDKEINLYCILQETDGLLSDYSSVIIDYLLLDKPIGMVLSDMTEYKDSRGFVFDPVADYFPGPIISNADELVRYISDFDEFSQQWERKRMELKQLFHKFYDGHSSERVCDAIFSNNR